MNSPPQTSNDNDLVLLKEREMSPNQAENKVRKILTRRFRQPFSKQKLPLKGKPDGKKFDLVSKDKRIVGEVKSCKYGNETTGNAGYETTRKGRLIEDLSYLERLDADIRKLLVLTNRDLWTEFSGEFGDLTSVEIIHVNPRTGKISGLSTTL